jgi:cystathionine beta-lyase
MENFDEAIDRTRTSSVKWDKYANGDILPMWVADMDFRSPSQIVEALEHRVEHGVFGYTHAPLDLIETVVAMLEAEYGWKVGMDSIVWLPGLVSGLNIACRAASGGVLTTIPVYPPFLSAPHNSGYPLSTSPLVFENNRWGHDFDDLKDAVRPETRLFLLCNPHNPTGRIMERSELEKIALLCDEHDLFICSDEIHCGLLLDGEKRHVPIASLAPEIEKRTITLMAPSKTFNIPGLAVSFAVIPNQELRRRFEAVMAGIVPHVNALGYTAALVAYRDCNAWRRKLIDYLAANRDLVEREIPAMGLSMAHVEATYLAWIDARPIDDPARFFEMAGVGLSDGTDFGSPGFVRLNFGCPRWRLEDALSRMKNALR